MIKAIIIDDEQHCTDRVVALLKPYGSVIDLIGEFSNVDAGIEGIKNLQPDLVFLDVQIHDQTGFDVLKAFGKHPFEVIFTTAFETYAVQAFKFSAIDYLLKPIDADDFEQAIKKVSEKLEAKDFSKKVSYLLHNVSKQDNHKKISIPTQEGFVYLDVSEIIRCQSDVNYTYIFIKNNRKILVSKTLKYFDGLLSNCGFFRVHNSHLVNLQYVKEYIKGKGGYVTMEDGASVEVSTRRKDEFIKAMRQFV